jgi:predicted membrane chloride channel (bestrophin family)
MALAFDNRFRQMMPLCQTDILTDQQLEQRLGDMVEGITVCERLANEPDPSVWQVSHMVLVSNRDRGS